MKTGHLADSKRSQVLDLTTEAHRRGHRVALSCRVFFFGDDDYEGEGRLMDISTGGCWISSDEVLPVGKILKISLFLKDYQWPLRIDQAIVRWAKDRTYGIEFTTIRLAQRERIRALVMNDGSRTP